MIPSFVCEFFIWVFGTLYPAYESYKAVKTKDVRGYVHWMTFWIVNAFFRSFEPVTDIFLGLWFPFYIEMKLGLVVCMIPYSKIIFNKFVYPALSEHEEEIDAYIKQTKEVAYATVVQFGKNLISYFRSTVFQTAFKHIQPLLPNGLLTVTENYERGENFRPRIVSEPGPSQHDFPDHVPYSKSVPDFEKYAEMSSMLSSDEDDMFSPMPKVVKKQSVRKKSKSRKAKH